MNHRLVAFVASVATVGCAQAQEAKAPKASRMLAVDAVELVNGKEVEGAEDRFTDRHGFRYRFASAENKAAFDRDPERYEIQLGGACAKMGPLSGTGSTKLRSVHEGRVYVFASEGCKATFLKDPEARIDRPDARPTGTPEAIARGAALMDQMLKGLGGAARVDGLKSVTVDSTSREPSGDKVYTHRRVLAIRFPDEVRRDEHWDDSYYGMVSSRAGAFFLGSAREAMHPVQRFKLEREFFHLPLVIARNRGRADFVALGAGERLTVWFAGVRTDLELEKETGRVRSALYRARGAAGALADVRLDYVGGREVDGVWFAERAEAQSGGKRWSAGDVHPGEVVLNADVERLLP
ncbi:MAG: YHS domain-containing protein [Phycisphaerales bacterium]